MRDAAAAAGQVWPAFVLVTGLLLIGLVVERDGLFASAGAWLARTCRSRRLLFAGAVALVAAVTAVLNLDTSVAFLTPVLVHTARSRRDDPAPLLYATVLLSNAASVLLPGANLTNIIVLDHLDLTGREVVRHMAAPFVASVAVTALVVAAAHRRVLAGRADRVDAAAAPTTGVGLAALLAATVLVVVLPEPALPVLAVGVLAVGVRLAQRRLAVPAVLDVVGPLTLVGLFALAVTAGAVGRAWSGPGRLLGRLDGWGTAALAAVTSLAINNLPAAALLSARAPQHLDEGHPYELLLGLGIGPNAFVTGSLAWLLWLRSARGAGAQPSLAVATRLGVVAAVLGTVAAVAALHAAG